VTGDSLECRCNLAELKRGADEVGNLNTCGVLFKVSPHNLEEELVVTEFA
jgi:hypothetical protein